jgi:hypothetical protein
MLKRGDIFEIDGDKWVVLEASSYQARYDMTLYTETEYSYLASRISKTGKPLKSMWRFSSGSGSTHWIARNQPCIGKAKVEVKYNVSDVNLTDF